MHELSSPFNKVGVACQSERGNEAQHLMRAVLLPRNPLGNDAIGSLSESR